MSEDGFASIDVRLAAVGQDLIGWTEFLHGKVSVEITAIQNLHCMSSPLSCVLPFTLYPFWTGVRVKGNPYPVITR